MLLDLKVVDVSDGLFTQQFSKGTPDVETCDRNLYGTRGPHQAADYP